MSNLASVEAILERQCGEHPPGLGEPGQRLEPVSHAAAHGRPGVQEEGHVRPDPTGQPSLLGGGQLSVQQRLHAQNRRGGVRGAAPQPGRHRNPLLEPDAHPGIAAGAQLNAAVMLSQAISIAPAVASTTAVATPFQMASWIWLGRTGAAT